MLSPKNINQYKNKTVDAASAMPDIRGKKILMGFWHNCLPNPVKVTSKACSKRWR